MNVFETVKHRRSVRRYADRAIEPEKLNQILESARLAPSSSNRQAWHFIVIDDPALRSKITEKLPLGSKKLMVWIKNAPVIIVGLYYKALTHVIGEMFGHENYLIDLSIAMTHMVLTATELDIGTCFVGWFNEQHIKRVLDIPANYRIGILLAMGYPGNPSNKQGIGGIKPRPRKKLSEIVSKNRFGEPFC